MRRNVEFFFCLLSPLSPSPSLSRIHCSPLLLLLLPTRPSRWLGIFTNVTGLTVSGVTVHAQRDAFDIISSRHVLVDNVTISGGGDDALALKSDYSLGTSLPSYDIVVKNSV